MNKRSIFTILCVLISEPVLAETDYQLLNSGQWRDPQTNLIWMRCSVGQSWTGSTCQNLPKEFGRSDTIRFVNDIPYGSGFAGYTTWRLPTAFELASIRYCSNGWKRVISHTISSIESGVSENVKGNFLKTYVSFKGEDIEIPERCADGSRVPTINTNIFPNSAKTPLAGYKWWSSENGAHGYTSLGISLLNGFVGELPDSFPSSAHIRLVRDN